MFGGALVGVSAAELDAADVMSDTRHNQAHALRFSLGCQTGVLCLCHYSAHSSFCDSAMWRILTCEHAGSESQLPPTQLPTHILYHWHFSCTYSAHRERGRDVEVGWRSENIILALHMKRRC